MKFSKQFWPKFAEFRALSWWLTKSKQAESAAHCSFWRNAEWLQHWWILLEQLWQDCPAVCYPCGYGKSMAVVNPYHRLPQALVRTTLGQLTEQLGTRKELQRKAREVAELFQMDREWWAATDYMAGLNPEVSWGNLRLSPGAISPQPKVTTHSREPAQQHMLTP